jgi:Dna[CI] antecedent, DciA
MNEHVPRAVSDLLVRAVPQLADRLLEHRVRKAWSSITEPDIARRARPGVLLGGCLEIIVDSSPWLCELTLRASDLHRRIAAGFPEVRSLRFTLGAPGAVGTAESSAVPANRPVSLSTVDIAEVEAAAAAIPDPQLADAARRLMLTARRRSNAGGHR